MHGEFVPVITSQAGSTLTYENWQAAGVETLALKWSSLVFKPGISLLSDIGSLHRYWQWPGKLILDVDTELKLSDDYCRFQSPWDGSQLCVKLSEMFELFESLQAELIIVPPELAKALNSTENAYTFCWQSKDEKSTLLISDFPASEGLKGFIYLVDGSKNINDARFKHSYEIPVVGCICPVCAKKFTLAYLHHLYQHTPLLASRYLIQHNSFQIVNCLKSRYDVTLSGQPVWPV